MADPQIRRIIRLVVTAVVLEAAFLVLGYLGPALQPLLVWVYPAVALIFAVIIWRARSRRQSDRRQQQRRRSG